MAGRLTTHVLDLANGRPAAGVKIELFAIHGDQRRLLMALATNHDGRTDAPFLSGEEFHIGNYELVFHIGDYFAPHNPVAEMPFLDLVPVRFNISDDSAHYHVPLLTTPWSYSTYRGS